MTIAAVGSISINMFNGVQLKATDLENAFIMSPLVGYSLRMGRDPTPQQTPQEELKESQAFLTAKLKKYFADRGIDNPDLSLASCSYGEKEDEKEPCLILPFEPISCRWYRSRSPDKGSEWILIQRDDKKPQNVLPLTMLLRMHLVKCEFVLDDNNTYSLFTDNPIGRQPDDLCLPFPLDPIIAGLPLEGSLISLIPLPLPTRAAWLRKTETIAEDVTSILLTNQDIGFVITCLLQPYCPNYPRVAFATVFVETEVVDPILPTVSGVSFPDSIIEGVKINFTRKMFPDREGESQILIERARGITEEWFLVAELKPDDFSYVPARDDAGHYLRVSYAPVTAEGVVGQTVYFYSKSRVLPTLPVFTNAVIGGLPKTNFTLCGVADYKGGRQGHSSYNWYFSGVPITSQNIKQLKLVASNTQTFTIPDDFKDGYLACEMVPVREDEVVGEAVYAALTDPIIEDDPPAEFPYELPKAITSGIELKFKEQVQFYVSSTKGFCGFTEVKRGTSLVIRDNWVGRMLRIVTNECDLIVGKILPAVPNVQSVRISAPNGYKCGETLFVNIQAQYLKPDRYEVIWMRCIDDIEKAVAFNTREYRLDPYDIGFTIKVRVTPFDDNFRYFEPTESDFSPIVTISTPLKAPIITGICRENHSITVRYGKEFDEINWLRSDVKDKWIDTKVKTEEYVLQSADVGHYLRAQIRIGKSILIATTQKAISPQKLSGKYIEEISDIYEGKVLTPDINKLKKVIIQPDPIYKWERSLKPNPTENDWIEVGNELSYTVTKEDVGCQIRFTYSLRHSYQNKVRVGKPTTINYGEVKKTEFSIKQNDKGNIECVGNFNDKEYKFSYFAWYTDSNGSPRRLGKKSETEFTPPSNIAGLEIYAIYCQIASDGTEGEQIRSSNKLLVKPFPAIESVDLLVKDGIVKVGEPVKCKAICTKGTIPKYQWYRTLINQDFKEIPDATHQEYVPVPDDRDCYLCCVVLPTNKKGWIGEQREAITATPVEETFQLVPQINHLNKKPMYWTGAILGTNLNVEVSWERENKDGIWIIVHDGIDYHISCNDIGLRIRAAINDLETKPSPTIVINPDIGSFVNATLRAKSFPFKARATHGTTSWDFFANESGLTMKSKNAKNDKFSRWSQVQISGIDGTHDEIELWMDASTKFQIVPLLNDDRRYKKIVRDNARDFIVYTTQQFISKFGND